MLSTANVAPTHVLQLAVIRLDLRYVVVFAPKAVVVNLVSSGMTRRPSVFFLNSVQQFHRVRSDFDFLTLIQLVTISIALV